MAMEPSPAFEWAVGGVPPAGRHTDLAW